MALEHGGARKIVQLATVDIASTAASTSNSATTVAVVGAAIGDAVAIAPITAPAAGTLLTGYVSAADVVTIVHSNMTIGAVDPASQNIIVYVIKKDSF